MATPGKRPPIDPERLKQLQAQLKKIEERENQPVKWHWSLTYTVAGGLAGAIISGLIYWFTMMSYGTFALLVLVPGVLAFLIQWKIFYSPKFIQKYFRINIMVYALYNLAGIGFTFSALFLSLNWLGASSDKVTERHRILGVDRNYIVDSNYAVVLLLENDAYENDPIMRAVPYRDGMRNKSFPFLDIIYSEGLLGFKIYHEHHVSPDPEARK
jgi:hypothetical protein